MSLDHFKATFCALGQDHIFEGVEELSDRERQDFLRSLESIDLPKVISQLKQGLQSMSEATSEISAFDGTCVDITNVDVQSLLYELEDDAKSISSPEIAASYTAGVASIARGEVAVVLLAGGQGSRLGFAGPKGMYTIDAATGVSIFELHSYRIRRLIEIARQAHPDLTPRLPWIIMTSTATHAATAAFFKEKHYFGLPEADVLFFQQSELPALAYVPVAAESASCPATTIDHPTRGRVAIKLVMRAPGQVALSPNGSGGVWPGVGGVLAKEPSLRYLHIVGVDNVLVLSADPLMVGTAARRGLSVLNKVVVKERPEEKVGVMASRGGKTVIVEYSELQDKADERTADGGLVYCDANIVSTMFHRSFVDRALAHANALPWHLAEDKSVACAPRMAAAMGAAAGPTEGTVKATKCEMFMFDVLNLSGPGDVGVLRSLRENQFAPVKNRDEAGFDCPATARALLFKHHQRLLAAAGRAVPATCPAASALAQVAVETYAGEGLRGGAVDYTKCE